jgi:hypothetical protein
MKYAIETGLVAMIYKARLTKIGPRIQNLRGGEFTDTAWRIHEPALRK